MNERKHLSVGDKINRLTVLELHHKDKRWRKYFLFKCVCGEERVIHGAAVVSGNTKSCGCLSTEARKAKRISDNHSEITAIILGYKKHARNRGFSWHLTREDVKSIIGENCVYCGTEPSNNKKTKNSLGDGLRYSGIDRVDSFKNYTKDNVVACCKVCNYAKSNMSLTEFHAWAIKLGEKAFAQQWGKS